MMIKRKTLGSFLGIESSEVIGKADFLAAYLAPEELEKLKLQPKDKSLEDFVLKLQSNGKSFFLKINKIENSMDTEGGNVILLRVKELSPEDSYAEHLKNNEPLKNIQIVFFHTGSFSQKMPLSY